MSKNIIPLILIGIGILWLINSQTDGKTTGSSTFGLEKIFHQTSISFNKVANVIDSNSKTTQIVDVIQTPTNNPVSSQIQTATSTTSTASSASKTYEIKGGATAGGTYGRDGTYTISLKIGIPQNTTPVTPESSWQSEPNMKYETLNVLATTLITKRQPDDSKYWAYVTGTHELKKGYLIIVECDPYYWLNTDGQKLSTCEYSLSIDGVQITDRSYLLYSITGAGSRINNAGIWVY